jgi:hypothetical protein
MEIFDALFYSTLKKIHVTMEIKGPEKSIYSIEVTKATRHDSPLLIPLLEQIDGEIGDVCGDKGLSSRCNAQYIAKTRWNTISHNEKEHHQKQQRIPCLAKDVQIPRKR